MRLIFLDIDGVLNSFQSTMYWDGRCEPKDSVYKLCPIATSNLSFILGKLPDVDIIISSTWRIHHTLEWLQEHLEKVGIPSHRIRGTTPTHLRSANQGTYVPRGHEIDWFIKDWHSKGFDEIKDFIIIDDDSDMDPHMDKLIQTNRSLGFSWIDVERIAIRWGIYDLPSCGF